MVSGPVFQAGGLASGLDTMGIIDALVGIEEVRVERIEQKKLDYTTKLTTLTDLIVKSQDLRRTLDDLKSTGVAQKITSTHTQFTPEISGEPTSGEYQLQVTQLARAAKARSADFSTNTDVVREGTLTLEVKGNEFDIAIADGDTLSDVAQAINESAAPVNATILFDGTNYTLNLTNEDTGHKIGEDPSTALSITETYTGTTGALLNLAVTQTAENATFTLDGLAFERQSNTVADAVEGVELSLTQTGTTPETLIIGRDAEVTAEKLVTFVDAYNELQTAVRAQLNVAPGTDTRAMLTGDSTVRAFARALDDFSAFSSSVSGSLGSLVNIGIERDRNGFLNVNETKVASVLASNSGDLDKFLNDDDGFAAHAVDVVSSYASVAGGALYRRQDDITQSMDELTDQQIKIQDDVVRFRDRLIRQFAAMEQTVSAYNSIGDFLTAQENRAKDN